MDSKLSKERREDMSSEGNRERIEWTGDPSVAKMC